MRVFGFDIGTTSIGSAVVQMTDSSDGGELLHLGVRIFPEARDPEGVPLNQERRKRRMMRRQLRRRKNRRQALNRLLSDHNLLPEYSADKNSAWAALMYNRDAEEPWNLRKRAISEQLLEHEVGRALYHLAKHRHFRGRDLEAPEADKGVDADEAKSQSLREQDRAALIASGKTLGAYLADISSPAERRRGHHYARTDVEAEFRKIVETQLPYHPVLRNPDFLTALESTIFHQRPVFWRRATLGRCRFIPGAELAASASWIAQEKRMLEKLNNLRIEEGNGRPLDENERVAILNLLRTQDGATWGGIRRHLKLYWRKLELTEKPHFNLERGGEKGLVGNRLENRLAEIFGNRWNDAAFADRLRREIHSRLYAADYGVIGERIVIRREVERRAARIQARNNIQSDFQLTDDEADALATLTFPTGWEPFSTQALEIVLPRLQEGANFGSLLASPEEAHWRDSHFPTREQPTGSWVNRLPSPTRDNPEELQRIREIRNPSVARVQNELRKVVNNLIDTYGKPDLIRVEVGRDVNKSKRERDETLKRNRDRETERKRATADLQSKGIVQPSGRDIEKWLLWKECREFCPYTGMPISFDALFHTGDFQVEHIWPRSRSFDDSIGNKTLCHVRFNARKANRTPFEAFEHETDAWEQALERVRSFAGPLGKVEAKARRFAAAELSDNFAARQLNDTRWAARQAVGFLKSLWPDEGPEAPVKVQIITGRVTAHLRRLWGLNNILSDDGEKTRADHRHHAIDALVAALAHGGYTQRLSKWFEAKDGLVALDPPPLDAPLADIRRKVEISADQIIVSHRVRRKISGPLHADTVYGDAGDAAGTGKATYRYFVTRKSVESLSKSRLADDEAFADAHVRDVLRQWIADHGGDPKKAFVHGYPTVSPGGPPIRKVRIRVKQQLALMAKVGNGFADLGSNHHLAAYRTRSGAIETEIVSLFEAATRLRHHQPVVARSRPDTDFVMTLGAGEMVYIPLGERQGHWVVQGVWASGQIVLLRANDAAGSSVFRPTAGALLKAGATKISVDPIGRVRKAND